MSVSDPANFRPLTVKKIVHEFGLDMRSHSEMLHKASERAKRYVADPKGTAFFEPRKRRENATSEEVKNHAIQFFKNVSTKNWENPKGIEWT